MCLNQQMIANRRTKIKENKRAKSQQRNSRGRVYYQAWNKILDKDPGWLDIGFTYKI